MSLWMKTLTAALVSASMTAMALEETYKEGVCHFG